MFTDNLQLDLLHTKVEPFKIQKALGKIHVVPTHQEISPPTDFPTDYAYQLVLAKVKEISWDTVESGTGVGLRSILVANAEIGIDNVTYVNTKEPIDVPTTLDVAREGKEIGGSKFRLVPITSSNDWGKANKMLFIKQYFKDGYEFAETNPGLKDLGLRPAILIYDLNKVKYTGKEYQYSISDLSQKENAIIGIVVAE